MNKSLYYEDIEVGRELKPLVKQVTTRQLVMWAGASGDYYQIHYDKDYALNKGLPGIIVHGQLTGCFLGQLITDWIGSSGFLRKLTCNYRGMNLPGETLIAKGKVTNKYIENGECCVMCNIWLENKKGEKTVSGVAVVILPTMAQK
ncbi:MaoC/PaaZ C-terminal domain-containing protein [Chloroflexota bacterium]